jgi:hypothetical protein
MISIYIYKEKKWRMVIWYHVTFMEWNGFFIGRKDDHDSLHSDSESFREVTWNQLVGFEERTIHQFCFAFFDQRTTLHRELI